MFVPGRLRNPSNRDKGRAWMAEAGYRKRWRHAVRLVVGDAMNRLRWSIPPTTPKRITLEPYAWNRLDRHGAWAATKPILDGLCPTRTRLSRGRLVVSEGAGIIDDDDETSGHDVIVCPARIDRQRPGVRITVEVL